MANSLTRLWFADVSALGPNRRATHKVGFSSDSCCKQANAYSIGACDLRHDLEPVVHRVTQILLAAQIALRRLDRDMAEQELNLFQFAAAAVAQFGAGSAKVMRGYVL